MISNKIKIEQALHGYSNGHHLLASSLNNISDKSSKLMSILSDLSGPEVVSGFEEYFTGYPLLNEEMFAISKTWYASEMKRPGCVWTHTLLIKYEYLKNCNLNLFALSNYFSRPNSENLDLDTYLNPIIIQQELDFVVPQTISKAKIEMLTHSLMSSKRPIILPSYSSTEYMAEIFTVIQSQLSSWGHFLTFCTGSLANRSVDKKTFDLQVVPQSIVKNVSRSNADSLVLDTSNKKEIYPKWVTVLSSEMMAPSNYNFRKFFSYFNSVLIRNRESVGAMAILYYETRIYDRGVTLSEFFDNVKKLFPDDIRNIIIYKTITGIFRRNNLEWFINKNLPIIGQLSILEDFQFNLNEDLAKVIKTSIEEMWNNDINSVKAIFDFLIGNNINSIGELIMTFIASKIPVDLLKTFTKMDLKACSMLILANNKLAFCQDLWKESRNFQLEILNCINNSAMDDLTAKNLLNTILRTTNEVLYKQLYNKFGKSTVSAVLSWYYEENKRQKVNKEWLNIGALDQTECMNWIVSSKPFGTNNMIYDLISRLNPYSMEVLQFGKDPWERILYDVNFPKLEDSTRLSLSLFLFPILILTNGKFNSKIASFVFFTINEKLSNQILDYDSWEKIEKILPEVPWFWSWDKCRRLRMAFERKGY